MIEHLGAADNQKILDYHLQHQIPVIYVRRADLVQRAISRAIALKTNRWQVGSSDKEEYEHLLKETPLSIDWIEGQIKRSEQADRVYSKMVEPTEALVVTYEDVFLSGWGSTETEVGRICDHRYARCRFVGGASKPQGRKIRDSFHRFLGSVDVHNRRFRNHFR